MNDARTNASSCAIPVPAKPPTRYELIDKDGRICGWFYSAGQAAQEAERLFPGQEQDEERSGKGWDVQVVGCDR